MDKRMYSLYFERSNGEEVLVKEDIAQEKDVFPLIKNFVKTLNPNYKIYCIRSWGENPITYDVGSHTEFFKLYTTKED